jgi:hypothetical protein
VGALGGPVGIAVTIGPPIKEAADREFDRRFPSLAPYRDAAWNATPIGINQSIANHPLNPLNPFGRWWDWAPWNKPDSPNSLNPPPTTSSPAIDPNGNWPIANPPESPIQFRVSISGTFYNYNNAFGQESTSQGFPATYEQTLTGIPQGFSQQIYPPTSEGQGPRTAWIFNYLALESGVLVPRAAELLRAQTAPTPGRYNSTYFSGASPAYQPLTGESTLAENQTPADLSGFSLAPESLFTPDAPPQYQPTGRPEAPPQLTPARSPAPLVSQVPRPSAFPRPQPAPAPTNNPTTQPSPQPDPSAIPSPWPFPFAPPFPAPYLNPAPSPSQNSSTSTTTTTYGVPTKAPNAFPDGLQTPNILNEVFPFPSFDPGLPPSDVDLCKDPCIKDMHETSQGQKPTEIEYQQFKGCNAETGEAEFETITMEVPAAQAEFTSTMLDKIAALEAQQCYAPRPEAYAAIPDSHEIKLNAIPPQLVIQYAEISRDGKIGSPKYSISIPYYRYSEAQTQKSLFPEYTKGQRFGVLVLPDNAKLIINAANEVEVNRVMKTLEKLIEPSRRNGAILSNNARRGQQLKQIRVVPRIAKYFTGDKNAKPEWIVYF